MAENFVHLCSKYRPNNWHLLQNEATRQGSLIGSRSCSLHKLKFVTSSSDPLSSLQKHLLLSLSLWPQWVGSPQGQMGEYIPDERWDCSMHREASGNAGIRVYSHTENEASAPNDWVFFLHLISSRCKSKGKAAFPFPSESTSWMPHLSFCINC